MSLNEQSHEQLLKGRKVTSELPLVPFEQRVPEGLSVSWFSWDTPLASTIIFNLPVHRLRLRGEGTMAQAHMDAGKQFGLGPPRH